MQVNSRTFYSVHNATRDLVTTDLKMAFKVKSLTVLGWILVFNCYGLALCADDLIGKLLEQISASQVQNDSSFSIFPFTWEQQKGTYTNYVKLNFHGSEQYYLLRDMMSVPDNNLFAPAWVSLCLMEAHIFGKAPRPTEDQLMKALSAIDQYRNRNVPYRNSEMTFWPQKWNATAKFYQSSPDNLFELLKFPDYLPDKWIEEVLKALGLKDIEAALEKLLKMKDTFAAAFHIPPDFDDTFVNLGLGGMLSVFHTMFPSSHLSWMKMNDNITSVFESVKKYAYRPFSQDTRQNTIDTRTYMYLRSFVEAASQQGQDVALVTTWLQDTEEVKSLFAKGVAMPFNINNVDATVSANFLYGMIMVATSTVILHPENYIDADLQKIFYNTTALLAHEIQTNLSSRPDLTLTYYPSKYEFFWFVSRSYAYLNRVYLPQRSLSTPEDIHQMLLYAFKTLGSVLHGKMTDDVTRSVKRDASGSLYIDDFLGDNDYDLFNKSVNRAEDRIFSTAVSINALINTWTLWQNNTLIWEKGTPDSVLGTVEGLVKWLKANVLSDQFKPWNTFFSGSGKGVKSMPFFYPANRREYFNGTTFSDKKFPTDFRNIIGMKGVVSHEEYDTMLKEPHFGMMTPMTFDGYNSEKDMFFPFWSCDAYTYAVSVLALSQYENIVM